VEILERIATSPASPRQISEATGEPLGRIVYHASVLHRTGCVRPVDPASAESSDCVYELATLLPSPPRLLLSNSTRGHVLASVLRRVLEQALAALKAGVLGSNPDHEASCESLLLDQQGWRETQAILEDAAARIAQAKVAAANRLAETGEAGTPTTVALAAFESAPESEPTARNPRG
jgi:hypothetical protein